MPAVPRLHRYYSVLRLPHSIGLGFGSPCHVGLPRCAACFASGPVHRGDDAHGSSGPCPAQGVVSGSLGTGGLVAESYGPPGFPGRPLHPCRSRTPRRVRRPLARLTATSLLPSSVARPWAPRTLKSSEAAFLRPTCSLTYASPTPLPTPSQGSLPTRRAQLWSGGNHGPSRCARYSRPL